MSIRFEGRVAVVTGAGGGLGRSHAMLLARLGASVVVNDPGVSVRETGDDRSLAERVVDEIRSAGGEATANQDSVADYRGGERIVQTALDRYGRLDILVNNAGILCDRSFAKMDLEDFRRVVDVHLYGTVNCTKAAWQIMCDQQYGRVVVTTSSSGISGSFGQSNYGAAKLGVVGFMHCLVREGAKRNVRVNAISPSAVTRMTETLVPPDIGRYLRPDLVSPAVAWLCSEQCQESGVIISAIGGYLSRIQLVESEGVQFDPTKPLTPEMVAEAYPRFARLESATPVSPDPLGNIESRLRGLGLL